MFYMDSDKREIKGWIDNKNDKMREKINEEIKNKNDEMKNIYNQFSKKIEKVVEQQQISDAQFQNQIQSQLDALKEDVDDLKENSKALNELDALKKDVDDLKENSKASSEFDALKNEIAELKKKISPAPLLEINSLKKEIGILRAEVAALKNLPEENETLKKEILVLRQVNAKLSQELTAQKTFATSEVVGLKNIAAELEKKIATAAPSTEFDALKNFVANLEKRIAVLPPPIDIDALKNILNKFKKEIEAVVNTSEITEELDALKKRVTTLETKPEEEPLPPPEEIFYLPNQEGVFLPNNREEIINKVKTILAVGDIEKYLIANPSESSRKFQKLLANHVKEAKKFVEKLKLKDLENEELSEAVTTKYFKIFQRTIFDNLLVAIKRGLKGSEEYYLGLLAKVNEYLARCGIYSVNTTSGRKAEAEDYENMSPQTLKTEDATKAEIITSIERLPYRINYLDEFGEQKYFQYAGIMNVYKAV